jgi:hypothetical protein
MRAVDTNVLVRPVTQDDPEQTTTRRLGRMGHGRGSTFPAGPRSPRLNPALVSGNS